MPRVPFARRPLLPLARLLYDFGARTKVLGGVDVSTEVHDGIQMRVYSPRAHRSNAAILWIFGGGHVAGKPEHLNHIASLAARELGVSVFVPKYRLAPRHPFPADLDDCFAAWNWLAANAQARGLSAERLAVAGHSAGGGLAAALAQKIRDHGGPQPRAQCLFYPMLDDRVAADRSLDEINHFIWNNKANDVAWSAYLSPNTPGSVSIPNYAAAARRDDLSALPPTWIGLCGIDLFADEDRDYARRLKEAGVECEVHEVDGAPHAFELFEPNAGVSREFERSAIAFLGRAL